MPALKSNVFRTRISGKFQSVLLLGPLVLALLSAPPSVADALPRPVALEPEIAFWRRIFSEIESDHGLIHDNRHLRVVYGTVYIPANASSGLRQKLFDEAKDGYADILQQLADGDRSGLSAEQQAVLALWPKDISNDELKQAADRLRVQQGLADRFEQGLVRSGQWLSHIQNHLQQAGVPQALAALPHVESSFDPTVYSQVGAAGLWQFTRSTGKHFMQIDQVVDSRRDPFMSSEAAAKLLEDNYKRLGSWPLAITAYNHGVTGMRRAVRTLGTDDIAEIVHNYNGRAFGFASRNFYVAFLAALEVEQNAESYFGTLEKALPKDEMVVTLPHFVPVAALEKTYGLSRSELKEANPALMAPVWNGSKYVPKGFTLRLPVAETRKSPEQILAAIPRSSRYKSQRSDLYHKVKPGEALSLIAQRYNTTVTELVARNNLKSRNRIRIGQLLRLPQGDNRVAVQ
jgi:membrane-bound lytic murein transglycosylase D